ncbi:hypothetical protein CHS0354_020899 [Potamilus streckersoni]|uniref:IC97/Casc1 N-terminal domain-containing protein n=1 Tax=Potamilus streckersoni TaxID=2493646 RepID=A0AAE0SVN5_9BIVA|nr:hypothetical protein CHS0354_020899 [Potamilus streckersoni]
MTALTMQMEANKRILENQHKICWEINKWARYMRCDGSPDPTIQGDINTYINLRREDMTHIDIDSVLKDSELDLFLINELDINLADSSAAELGAQDVARYKTTKEDLQRLIQVKLDTATIKLLQEATDRRDPETLNLQYIVKNDNVCLCLWGNLSKNPRIKTFEFAERGFSFEIPKVLSLSGCAYRVLFTKYDHYSDKCKSYYSRLKKKEVILEPVLETVKEDKEEVNEEVEGEKKEGEEVDGEEGTEKEKTELDEQEPQMKEEEVKEEEKEEEVPDFHEPPTPEPLEWEDFDEDDDVIDLRANNVVGGVFHFNLMHLPPQPKTANNWIITRLVDPPEIEYIDYVADTAVMNPNKEGHSPTQADKGKESETKRDEKPPIGVTMRLADGVMFTEEPQVARWDYQKNHWRSDGFSDYKFDEVNRTFHFKTSHFGTLALLQDAHINMPFQSWEIRPHKMNSAVFTIIAAIVEIEIEIKDAMCCLSRPDNKPELESIRNKWVTPKELVKMCRLAGINVFPMVDSSKYVSIQNKHPKIEERTYQQMALTASAMAYSWSKWNSDIHNREKILFQGAESLNDEPLPEEDWALYLMTKRRGMKLKMVEFDDTFNEELAEGTQFKSNLYNLLLSIGSEQVKERIKETSYEFVDCVQQLLMATKILTYS